MGKVKAHVKVNVQVQVKVQIKVQEEVKGTVYFVLCSTDFRRIRKRMKS